MLTPLLSVSARLSQSTLWLVTESYIARLSQSTLPPAFASVSLLFCQSTLVTADSSTNVLFLQSTRTPLLLNVPTVVSIAGALPTPT